MRPNENAFFVSSLSTHTCTALFSLPGDKSQTIVPTYNGSGRSETKKDNCGIGSYGLLLCSCITATCSRSSEGSMCHRVFTKRKV